VWTTTTDVKVVYAHFADLPKDWVIRILRAFELYQIDVFPARLYSKRESAAGSHVYDAFVVAATEGENRHDEGVQVEPLVHCTAGQPPLQNIIKRKKVDDAVNDMRVRLPVKNDGESADIGRWAIHSVPVPRLVTVQRVVVPHITAITFVSGFPDLPALYSLEQALSETSCLCSHC
jgi:hypothetical protein